MEASHIYQIMTRHRLSLFGFAVIWIFFRHTFYYDQVTYGFADPLVQIGDCGVDVFLFLSGFGLYFSYAKSLNEMEFYKKRLLRITPPVIVLLAFFAITKDLLQNRVPTSVLHPRYWFDSIYSMYWFIGAIFAFYLFYPLFVKLLKKINVFFWGIVTMLSLVGVSVWHMNHMGLLDQLVVYFARVPVFILGIVFAHNQNFLRYRKTIIGLCILSTPFLFFLPKDFQRLLYFPLAVTISVYLPLLLDRFPKKLLQVLNLLGKASLEFYLIHVFLLSIGLVDKVQQLMDTHIYTSVAICFVLIALLSIFCSTFFSKLLLGARK